jgi:transposase-like protein
MMRKRYTPQFKAKVVREILREEKSISQLAAEYGVHATQLRKWKKVALEKLPDLFVATAQTNEELVRLQQEQEQLYAEIGKLTTQLTWLKKKGIEIE